jgi:two-component system cell cycle sensor histidine kinase/response regulator CckA
VTHDVTDRRNLEERLRQGQKMEAIGQLAGGVAHDFNNLLTAILGYADWLSADLSGDPRHEQVAQIQKAAERAADLTQQLLTFSRRQLLQPAAVNLSDLVVDLLPMLRRVIGGGIEVVDLTAPALPAVLGDRGQLERIIMNLAVNARDAMPSGGTLTIRTSEVWLDEGGEALGPAELVPGPYVLLGISDTGIGMDAETRRRAFEPFFTTKDVGRGTGLGLSTVYGIVQQMGGAIEVESEPDRGATFRLYFPQASGVVAAPVVPSERGSETVLLVEDEDALRRYLTHVLESHGYRVIAAEHVASALALTQSFGERIDLVISDVAMPGSTGPELVRLIGQARPGLSALFISGNRYTALAPQAHAISVDQLLVMPFSSAELLSKVRQILAAA